MDCGVLERATRLTLKLIQILWAAPSLRRLKYALLLLLCYLASYTGTLDHFSKVNWGCAQPPSTCILCFCYLLVFAMWNDFSLTHLFPPTLSCFVSVYFTHWVESRLVAKALFAWLIKVDSCRTCPNHTKSNTAHPFGPEQNTFQVSKSDEEYFRFSKNIKTDGDIPCFIVRFTGQQRIIKFWSYWY